MLTPKSLTRVITAAVAIATIAGATAPAIAQSRADDDRFRAAQERFDREYQLFRQESDRYAQSRARGAYYDNRYAPPQSQRAYADDAYDPSYDPER